MTESIADNVLAHFGIEVGGELKQYGVKGMKWGVVRERGSNGRVKRTVSSDHEESRASKKKPISQMSNAELKRLNERLELERKNNQLQSRSGISKIKKGTEMAGVILAVGTTVSTAYNFVKSPTGQAIINTVKKSLNNR